MVIAMLRTLDLTIACSNTRCAGQKCARSEWELAACLLAVDRSRAWKAFCCASTYEYADRFLGLSGTKVSSLLRVARALEFLPALSECMRNGEITWCKVREITRVATPETEAEWICYARENSIRTVEQRVARRPRSVVAGATPAGSGRVDAAAHALGLPPVVTLSPSEVLEVYRKGKREEERNAEAHATFEAAREKIARRLGRRLSAEEVLHEMASIVLASGDARTRARYPVIIVDERSEQPVTGSEVDLGGAPISEAPVDGGETDVDKNTQLELRGEAGEHACDRDGAHSTIPIAAVAGQRDIPLAEVSRSDAAPLGEAKRHRGESTRRNRRTSRRRRALPTAVIKAVLARAGYRCERCGRKRFLEIDHIEPVSEGGSNDPANLRALCAPCHSLRHREDRTASTGMGPGGG